MSTAAIPDAKFQIAHVLFIDIVGYSKLLVNDQAAAIRQLNEVVQGTDEFRTAGRRNKLVRIPTGDGMALVFRDSPESPVRCALAISRAIKNQSMPLRIRMGIHSGLVHGIPDVNNRLNVAGAGINLAQRVMDCGDTGHILLSKHVAEDLEHDARWHPLLHDLGPCEVKHGVQVGLVNLHDAEAGNPNLPQAVRRVQKRRRRNAMIVFSGTAAVSLLVAIGSWVVSTNYSRNNSTAEKQPSDAQTAVRNLTLVETSGPAPAWPPRGDSPAPVRRAEKLFAGTWRGTVRNAGPKGSTTSQVEITIDDSEKRWSNLGPGNSSPRGRTLSYTRSYRLGGTNVRQTAELSVNEDGRTATYKSKQVSITGKIRSVTSAFGTVEKTD